MRSQCPSKTNILKEEIASALRRFIKRILLKACKLLINSQIFTHGNVQSCQFSTH